MKLIKQQDRSGCGIACVAMVTGMAYEAVRRIWLETLLGDHAKLHRAGDGLNAGDIVMLLGHIGVHDMRVMIPSKFGWRIEDASGKDWAIFCVKTEHGFGHWMVDSHGEFLDPAQQKDHTHE